MTALRPRAHAILDRADRRAADPAFYALIQQARAGGASWDGAIRQAIAAWDRAHPDADTAPMPPPAPAPPPTPAPAPAAPRAKPDLEPESFNLRQRSLF